MSVVSAAGALLWMTHTLLQEHNWVAEGLESETNRLHRLETFGGDVNLLPAQCYKVLNTSEEIHVRGLLVGNKLFVHFVSTAKSIRLSLRVSEFVKPRGQQMEQGDGDQGRVLYTDKWRCNLEILCWRLERNLFPEFSSDASLVASDAELSRLPELLLARLGKFLNAPDFCRLTQTNKYLHQLQDSSELWKWFLLRGTAISAEICEVAQPFHAFIVLRHFVVDFPTNHLYGDLKSLYILQWTYRKRMETSSQQDQRLGYERRFHEYFSRQGAHWRGMIGGRLPAAPLHLPMPPPFHPLGEDPWPIRSHLPGLVDMEDLGILGVPDFYLE